MKMSFVDIDLKMKDAIHYFWSTQDSPIGKMNGFITLIKEILIENGVNEHSIFYNTNLELPGYFRPYKRWDLLVVDGQQLILAISFYGQIGPSFGYQFSHHSGEVIGSAFDFWTSFRERLFKDSPPWLGYFTLVEDCTVSSVPLPIPSAHFPIIQEFEDSSYIKRYEILCHKLILERQYSAACLLTSKRDQGGEGHYSTPSEKLSFITFITSMLAPVWVYLATKDHVL